MLVCVLGTSILQADFPVPYNSEPNTNSSPLHAIEAAASFRTPPGFHVRVAASEPDVQNPIAMAWDAQGRLWIVENYTYAERAKRFDLHLRDRILVFDSQDDQGRFRSRKIFTDELQAATSVEVGHGGVWIMCPPQLLFVPDSNHDAAPDGPAQVVLDGFTIPSENYHGFANGLRFGPDGWLYGRCGASAPAEVGKPGASKSDRIPVRGTLWRYHPQRKLFETLSSGTTNPWGHDWNEFGELFFINTVNGHLWHGITGAHYARPHTIDPNPYTYQMIDMHADHWHFDTASDWTKSRDGAANSFGGGHAHIGMMIYQGDNWPTSFQGHLFTWNMHGRRANQEILTRTGSGYTAHHGQDVFLAKYSWFRGMDLSTGPDGSVFAIDWSDTGECHDHTGVHRRSGRIFQITHGTPIQRPPTDLTQLAPKTLAALHTETNNWWPNQARLELARRAALKADLTAAVQTLQGLFDTHPNPAYRLRALWTLHAIGALSSDFLTQQLTHPNEHVRTWAIRLLTDSWPLDTPLSSRPPASSHFIAPEKILSALTLSARVDASALVRLTLCSTLQRLPKPQRTELAIALGSHAQDASDHNLPLMLWYGLIPIAETHLSSLATIGSLCELPLTRELIARRLAEDIDSRPDPLNALLQSALTNSPAFQADILKGIASALTGRRKAPKPAPWDLLASTLSHHPNSTTRDQARSLSVLFGDGRALEDVKRVALDASADLTSRKVALQTLIENAPPDLRSLCERLIDTRFLNTIAIRGLSQFNDPTIGERLARSFNSFHPSERSAVLDALVSRPSFAQALLTAVGSGKIPRNQISAFHARQIRSLNDASLTRQLEAAWGQLRDADADKQQRIAALKRQLTPDALAKANLSQGRSLFVTACSACHTLFGHGGSLGPDLTGAGRDDLDYILHNVVDPSAVVSADFRMSVATLKDGRVLNGIVESRSPRTLRLRTLTESITIELTELSSLEESKLSIMPEGLLDGLTPSQILDLVGYLQSPSQIPLPTQ